MLGAYRHMNKAEIYQYLTQQNISYEACEHEAVFNMEEAEAKSAYIQTITQRQSGCRQMN